MSIRKDYFKTFCSISHAFGTTHDKEKLLDLIVHNAIDVMEGKAACLFLEDKDNDVFIPVCRKGLSENYLHSDPYKGKKLSEEMMERGYLAFNDVANDSRIENRDLKAKEGIAAILVVPVVVEQKIIGVLSLYTATARDFNEDEIDFLKALANQGGIAIQNARLVERIIQNATLFHDMSDSINSTQFNIKKILHILTADIAETFGMKGANIRLKNEDTGTLELVASYGLSEEFLNKGPIDIDKSVLAALEGEAVVIRDARTDERIQYRDAMKKEGIVSVMVLPIQSGDEIIGVMCLCCDIERDYPKDIRILAEALAHQGGIAIQNASMYLSLQEDKKELEEDIWSHRQWF